MRLKYIDGLMGFVVGDAMGVPLEFKSRKELFDNPVTKMIGFGTHNQPEGTWSDDTSMLIATIDSINAKNKIDYIIEKTSDLTKIYVEYFTIRFMRYNNVTDMIISAFPETQEKNIETYFNILHKILNNI